MGFQVDWCSVEIQPEVHKKGHIIFHVHIDGIFQGDDRQLLRIRIGGSG